MPSTTVVNDTALVGSNAGQVKSPAGVYSKDFHFNLASMTTLAADLATSIIFPHRGKILSLQFNTSSLGTGSGASQVLNFAIAGVAIVGGVLTLTLATTTPLGNLISGTPITGGNEFAAGDAISLKVAAGGTIFTAGAGTLTVFIQNLDG